MPRSSRTRLFGCARAFIPTATGWCSTGLSGAVDYTVAQQGDTVQITFSRPGKADFAAVQRAKLRNVPTVGQATVDGRLVVQITIPPGSGIKHFRPGSGGVAIDIVDPPKNGAPAPAQAGSADGSRTRGGATSAVSAQAAGAREA